MTTSIQQTALAISLIPLGIVLFNLTWTRNIERDVRDKTSKKYADETFQSVKLCDERSQNIEKTLERIEKNVEAILRNGNKKRG